ncbi:hypothetical protein P153DRAFT_400618 [Dothidotthia symphoricarpi CBS 119687]|uniref:Uncharacterized protein n=1 Tax=Dothidotthia symphoricarpi CBS 119687 TaxID=1392245 RepID=A0A6A5ZZG2_9PLEO|nr:uncharacterized protein P153DRAFT_400618 [Dothidotthia symphoricarpi CBS 119687]KAF2125132.1 hypothetical protein P153DRAFT_400618 [Dothidotthia symphoricarpi CBS 119687]
MSSTPEKYDSDLKDDGSTASLLSSDEILNYETGRNSRRTWSWTWPLAFCISLLLTNMITSVVTYRTTSKNHRSVAEPPTGVPNVFRDLSLTPRPTLLNVTFYDRDDSIYRKRASAEADEAWKELAQSEGGVMLIPKEDAKQSDIDPEKHAYWDAPELGLEGYPVGVEVLHQLHCLDMLRRNLWFNIDFTREQARKDCPESKPDLCGEPQEFTNTHIDHCVDFLRHRLMCTSDLGVVPLLWLGREGRMTGDMSRMHTCRNYDTVLPFVSKKGVSMPEKGAVKPKADDYVIWDYI